jgi:putative FmdB family regulatory protein
MPIYAYRCSACGHAQDVLQKISDPLLTVCPACGQSSFVKQVTAAGFQLKGSGWYVTDFRNNGAARPAEAKGQGEGEGKGDDKGATPVSDKPAETAAGKPAEPAPASGSSTAAASSSAPAASPKSAAAPPAAG